MNWVLRLAFLKNRFSLVAVVYQQKLKDGIVFTNTASSSGFKSSLVNAANTENKGLELGVKAVSGQFSGSNLEYRCQLYPYDQ